MTIRIIIADDHNIVREGFRLVLEAQKDFQVVGEARDGLEAIRLVEKIEPDVLVVDLMMPGVNGLEVARQLKGHTHIVVLSMHNNEAYVLEALRNGVLGYVLKDASTKELVKAVRYAARGQRYLSEPFTEKAIDVYLQLADSGIVSPYEGLTNREHEVLHFVAQGYNNTKIGETLNISPRTVEVHRSNLMHKLGFRNQADLIRFALKKGILPMEDDDSLKDNPPRK
jgi:DNA-binding NarL/FixJ family response regulator